MLHVPCMRKCLTISYFLFLSSFRFLHTARSRPLTFCHLTRFQVLLVVSLKAPWGSKVVETKTKMNVKDTKSTFIKKLEREREREREREMYQLHWSISFYSENVMIFSLWLFQSLDVIRVGCWNLLCLEKETLQENVMALRKFYTHLIRYKNTPRSKSPQQ